MVGIHHTTTTCRALCRSGQKCYSYHTSNCVEHKHHRYNVIVLNNTPLNSLRKILRHPVHPVDRRFMHLCSSSSLLLLFIILIILIHSTTLTSCSSSSTNPSPTLCVPCRHLLRVRARSPATLAAFDPTHGRGYSRNFGGVGERETDLIKA